MAQYQAGMLVAYGKLGVHEIETVGLQSFCGKPAKITIPFALILRIPTTTAISPRQKKVLCARCPGTQQAEADLHASKKCDHVEKATEFQREAMSPDGCSLGGACLTRLLALEKIPVEPLNARLDKDSRSNWSKYRICSIALLLYTF